MPDAPIPPDGRRCVPVRLDRMPLERRMEAARVACKHESGEEERQDIVHAALHPSSTTYWVAP